MRQPLVAGNWKMNGSRTGIKELVAGIKQGMAGVKRAEVAVCPPAVYLSEVAALLEGSRIGLGAQNVCQVPGSGAYTGEISGAMLAELNCKYVIVGHSERRTIYGEDDELVAKRFMAACEVGLHPILCVGELLEERERSQTEAVVARQLDAVLALSGSVEALQQAVIAYEPVWAIGTGKTASPGQAQEVHAYIRYLLTKRERGLAERIQILYGGSVNAANAEALFAMADIDGGLIGGASLKVDDFLAICRAA